ncbi:MAG: hypothetical protein COY40_05195 [Alphaproteobacteria bacterium CG_4_10_14_0_8_um_filter_53_9]|nr:MAG: hypothetical protein COY40_05195 [Alphaproteobacteria bacterium CG_4_10_14_0_8_um_filter_53_9]
MKKTFAIAAALTALASYSHAADLDAVEARVRDDLKSKIVTDKIIAAIKAQNEANASLSEADVKALDDKWQGGDQAMIDAKLGSDVSQDLKKMVEGSAGFYGEIFLMDNKGLNVAQSDKTSDYWQGDEAKWQKTYLKGAGALFVDDVEFDESSQSFTTQVNAAIADPATGEVIGAVTFGVNVEE